MSLSRDQASASAKLKRSLGKSDRRSPSRERPGKATLRHLPSVRREREPLGCVSDVAGGRPGLFATEAIRAFCIDFNWGPGGPNGFAPPGLWADADPEQHLAWYAGLGANVIQTFAVSCNGYAWYTAERSRHNRGCAMTSLRNWCAWVTPAA